MVEAIDNGGWGIWAEDGVEINFDRIGGFVRTSKINNNAQGGVAHRNYLLSELNNWAGCTLAVTTPTVLPPSAYDSGPAYPATISL